MERALKAAQASPDPSTQNGGVLLFADGRIVTECNRFPDGVLYKPERWERPLKYEYIEHAERNCYYKAAHKGLCALGSTLICAWAACSDCARAIIQSGSQRLVRLPMNNDANNPRWQDTISTAEQILIEGGIEVIELDGHFGIKLRRDGELREF